MFFCELCFFRCFLNFCCFSRIRIVCALNGLFARSTGKFARSTKQFACLTGLFARSTELFARSMHAQLEPGRQSDMPSRISKNFIKFLQIFNENHTKLKKVFKIIQKYKNPAKMSQNHTKTTKKNENRQFPGNYPTTCQSGVFR